jgi:flagellar biosynthesis regulator FlaF
MPKNYSLGRNRYLAVKKLNRDILVTIAEEGSDVKTVTFHSRRWAQFVKTIGQVDKAVNNLLTKQYVQLSLHIGGKCHIGDDGVRVRRHSPILLQLQVERSMSEQERYRSTTSEMDRAEGHCSTTTPETSGVIYHPTLQLSARSSEYRGNSIVLRMSYLSVRRAVTFDKRITIFRFNG